MKEIVKGMVVRHDNKEYVVSMVLVEMYPQEHPDLKKTVPLGSVIPVHPPIANIRSFGQVVVFAGELCRVHGHKVAEDGTELVGICSYSGLDGKSEIWVPSSAVHPVVAGDDQ